MLAQALSEAFPGVPVSGCSTAGEIGPSGMMQGGLVLIGFPREGFRVHSELITDIDRFGVEHATDAVRRLKARVSPKAERLHPSNMFALLLVDGLSNAEENIVAAIHWEIDDIELIGGSAGDGIMLQAHGHDPQRRPSRTAPLILMMIESDYPFRVFKTQNFEPTGIKLVVTAADTENRIVYELNAEPAAREYAAAIGLLARRSRPVQLCLLPARGEGRRRLLLPLDPQHEPRRQPVVLLRHRRRSSFHRCASARHSQRHDEHTLQGLDTALGGIDLVVGFDCILRRLDAETRQIRHQLAELYRKYSVAGFHTYGEQYNAMHLNQTLTGIAFGQRTTEV